MHPPLQQQWPPTVRVEINKSCPIHALDSPVILFTDTDLDPSASPQMVLEYNFWKKIYPQYSEQMCYISTKA